MFMSWYLLLKICNDLTFMISFHDSTTVDTQIDLSRPIGFSIWWSPNVICCNQLNKFLDKAKFYPRVNEKYILL